MIRFFFLFLLVASILSSCNSKNTSTPEALDPHIEIFPKDIPADIPVPIAREDGVYLSGKRILNFVSDELLLGCQRVTAYYSPSFEYFLIINKCVDIGEAYLYRTSDGRRVDMTSSKDALWSLYSWSPKGHSLLYHRDYCCSDEPHLPEGAVLYNLVTGSQTYLISAFWRWQLPEWSPDGRWLAYLTSACRIEVINVETYQLWLLDSIPNCVDDAKLVWEARSDILLLHYNLASASHNRDYSITDDRFLTRDALPYHAVAR